MLERLLERLRDPGVKKPGELVPLWVEAVMVIGY
jgi:hypothetical protein